MRLSNLTASSRRTDGHDDRPTLAVGHVPIDARDIGALADFYAAAGCRRVARLPGVAILELRGGTHLAISRGSPGRSTLDLIVDDLDECHDRLAALGAEPSVIRRRVPHRRFTARDPEGNVLVVHDSHVVGPV